MAEELAHQFELNPATGNCVHDELPERAGVHLITAPQLSVARSVTISLTEMGMNVVVSGVLDPSEYALMSVVLADMSLQAIRQATAMAMPQDHKKKGGRN